MCVQIPFVITAMKLQIIILFCKFIPKMRQSRLLSKPFEHSPRKSLPSNIFQITEDEKLPSIDTRSKFYDYVGSKQIRTRLMNQTNKKNDSHAQNSENVEELNHTIGLNTTKFNNTATIKRNTILQKVNQSEHIDFTKQQRNIKRYKEYQQFWSNECQKIKKFTNSQILKKKQRPTLLQSAKKQIQIIPNQQKQQILNTYIVKYWEMSLRNNNDRLRGHIKGNTFQKNELQQLLQREEGRKHVEASIPVLPIEKLQKLPKNELCLSGRSKLHLQQSIGPSTQRTQRYSNAFTGRKDSTNNEEVYKVNYDGHRKWFSMEGL